MKGTSESNLEGRLAAVGRIKPGVDVFGRGKRLASAAFESFPEVPGSGMSIADAAQLQRTKSAFEGPRINGSRHVNMYAGVLGGIGGMLTGGHVGAGAAAGALFGGWVDKYGPSAAKKVLDAYLDHFGNVKELTGVASEGALRATMAKAVDSGKVDAEAFKSTAQFMDSAAKGDKAADDAVKASVSGKPLKDEEPTDKERATLDRLVRQFSSNPEGMADAGIGSKTGVYMPEHGTAIGVTAANAVQYLAGLRPGNNPQAPLDPKMPPEPGAMARYRNALNIAQQPLIVLSKMKNGTLTQNDVMALNALYPALAKSLQMKLVAGIAGYKSKPDSILPYKTIIGMSMLTGQPLNSTLMAASIIAAQPKPPMQTPGTAMQPASNPKRSMAGIAKMPRNYETQSQRAESGLRGKQ